MANEVTIRKPTHNDVGALVRLYLQLSETLAELDPHAFRVPDEAEVNTFLIGGLRSPSFRWLVAVAEDVVGYVRFRVVEVEDIALGSNIRREKHGNQLELVVDGAHREKGIGGQLMAAAHDLAKAEGATYMELGYHVLNEASAALCAGFEYERKELVLTTELDSPER